MTGPTRLLAGMIVATDLDRTRQFYERFLGLECVRAAPDRLLAQDRGSKAAMEAGQADFFVLDVRQVDRIGNPQRQLNHWGLTVRNAAEVDRIHAAAKAMKDDLGIAKLSPVADLHGAHSFYMADHDTNWWEIERRMDGEENEGFLARGDFDPARPVKPQRAVDAPAPQRSAGDPVALGAELTHGTMEQADLPRARRFITQVLGLRCVQHIPPAQIIAGPGPMGIFGIRHPRPRPQEYQNRWVVGVDGQGALEAVAERASASSAELGLLRAELASDRLSCDIQDADGNWWQVVVTGDADYRMTFERGDA